MSCCTLPDIAIGIEAGGIEFIDENGGGPGARHMHKKEIAKYEKKSPAARRTRQNSD
jgi:hypothetical protein